MFLVLDCCSFLRPEKKTVFLKAYFQFYYSYSLSQQTLFQGIKILKHFKLGGDSMVNKRQENVFETCAQDKYFLHRTSQVILLIWIRLQKNDKQQISK